MATKNQIVESIGRLLRATLVTSLASILILADRADANEFDFFESKIRPVLAERCYKCHSATSEKLKGGLLLDTRDGMLQGGESGKPAVLPGKPNKSLLIEAIQYKNQDLQMPPKQRLSEQQVADFIAWISSGAPDPRTNAIAIANRPAGANTHWAFLPPKLPALPKVNQRSWPKTPIDFFILSKLETKGLSPSPPANKRTLIRRACYDLTGLPPTAAEVEAFEQDRSSAAFEKVIDHLLSSPHYGERWGRHWLDVARYSDTKGYVYDREEKRFVHSQSYRDWVIRAFNDDLPYDQFLMLQLAADQMLDQHSQDSLAAMGFLTLGRRFLGVVHDIIDDRIDVMSRGMMGLTVACARCHDHKFDPIPTKDYYSLYGVFYNTAEKAAPLSRTPPDARTSDAQYREFLQELKRREDKLDKAFQKSRDDFTDRLRRKAPDYLLAVLDTKNLPTEEFYAIMGADDINPVIVRQWEAHLFKTRDKADAVFSPWHAYASLPASEFKDKAPAVYEKLVSIDDPRQRANPLVLGLFAESPPASMKEVAQRYGKLLAETDKAWREVVNIARTNKAPLPQQFDPNREPIRQVLYAPDSPAAVPHGALVDMEWFFDESTRVELSKLQAEIDRWIIKSPAAPPYAVTLQDRPSPKNTRVFVRGNPANKGEEVPRQFLQVVSRNDRRPFEQGSGRLELARAIASRDNPLTARVMVNRIWQHHFGAGLVKSASDFGARCDQPSHPELLDWLAVRFMDQGWSIKQLHREIMLSSVYQQSSSETKLKRLASRRGTAAGQVDPENRLLWRMNSQRLDFESLRDSLLIASGELDPRIGGAPAELFKRPFSTRRTVYGYIDRQFVPGVFRVFDFANPDLHIPQRSDTTVPQQALFFMNSPFVVERARALLNRAEIRTVSAPRARVQQLYRLLYQREATRTQIDEGLEFMELSAATPAPPPIKPVSTPWLYGYGELDAATNRIKVFVKLPHFTGDAWQGGAALPDAKLGWVQLTAEGGHAGNDLQHAAIRRWIAPMDATVAISGTIRHENKEGDGIHAYIISSRAGLLSHWPLHNTNAAVKLEKIEVKTGDTMDFIVDMGATLSHDNFKWAPTIAVAAAGMSDQWDARKEFAGPPPIPPKPLSAWEKYAQVLLLANEFLFVD